MYTEPCYKKDGKCYLQHYVWQLNYNLQVLEYIKVCSDCKANVIYLQLWKVGYADLVLIEVEMLIIVIAKIILILSKYSIY